MIHNIRWLFLLLIFQTSSKNVTVGTPWIFHSNVWLTGNPISHGISTTGSLESQCAMLHHQSLLLHVPFNRYEWKTSAKATFLEENLATELLATENSSPDQQIWKAWRLIDSRGSHENLKDLKIPGDQWWQKIGHLLQGKISSNLTGKIHIQAQQLPLLCF